MDNTTLKIKKPRIKRQRITGKYSMVTQDKILLFLTEEAEETVFIEDATQPYYVTPDSVRDKGIIVCSECGHYNSDSLSHCKYCHDPLVFIRAKKKDAPNRDKDILECDDYFFYLLGRGRLMALLERCIRDQLNREKREIKYRGILESLSLSKIKSHKGCGFKTERELEDFIKKYKIKFNQ